MRGMWWEGQLAQLASHREAPSPGSRCHQPRCVSMVRCKCSPRVVFPGLMSPWRRAEWRRLSPVSSHHCKVSSQANKFVYGPGAEAPKLTPGSSCRCPPLRYSMSAGTRPGEAPLRTSGSARSVPSAAVCGSAGSQRTVSQSLTLSPGCEGRAARAEVRQYRAAPLGGAALSMRGKMWTNWEL